MLRGLYGGSRGEFALLAGSSANLEDSPVGAGACGVASLGHWPVPLDQHHWLELRVRTGNRAFELISTLRNRASQYDTKHLLVPFGCDFRYQNGRRWPVTFLLVEGLRRGAQV